MLEEFRESWQAFKQAELGGRFERLYYRRESRPSWRQRSAFLGLGILLMLIGLVLMAAPGPGTVVFLLGAVVAAQESLHVARAMDWVEIRLWRAARFARDRWRTLSTSAKFAMAFAAVAVAASASLAGYKLLASVL